MTHEEMIAAIAAHRDGKAVQARMKEIGTWRDFKEGETPVWNFHECDYRAKPEPPKPREFWVIDCIAFDSCASADLAQKSVAKEWGSVKKIVHVREVLPE